EAWLHSQESESPVDFPSDSLNPHFAYQEDNGVEHQVWYLDAVTAFNEMRAARRLGIRTFALWRLGSEDRSLWTIWDSPSEAGAEQKLKTIPAGQDVDREGYGEVLYVEQEPSAGSRDVTLDPETHLIASQKMITMPLPYKVSQNGAQVRNVALSFD